ncbi:hypothetical protein Goklo_024541, partial [Gossypium klotzschianum]|nr:hypothetical protein [Gossypium klotzschianum]
MYSPKPNSVLVHIRLLYRKLIMEKGFLEKVEDNAAVRTWSETTQHEKCDSLAKGYVSKFCFTFGKVDLVPTIEEYMDLLRCSKIQVDRAYSRAINKNLKDIILAHPNTKKRVDVIALGIYNLFVFPKTLRHVDKAV